MKSDRYQLIDSGHQQKLEAFGPYLLCRPAYQAIWQKTLPKKRWINADSTFTREGKNAWRGNKSLPESWIIEHANLKFKIMPTNFGHLGLFPEHAIFWPWMQGVVKKAKKEKQTAPKVLNLFAYSGGATLALAKAGASLCHVDASKGMVQWAKENAEINGLSDAPIRWIVDDAVKFVKREVKRKKFYDAIILDPPSFGRGAKGEVFKIEEDLLPLLKNCTQLLTERPLFILLSCHTPGYTPLALSYLLSQVAHEFGGKVNSGEMLIEAAGGMYSLPSGSYARWIYEV